MKTRDIAVFFLAALLCGCANPGKKKSTDTPKNDTMVWVSSPNREERRKAWDRMQTRANIDDGKPFQGTSSAKVRDFRTGTYEGSKEAPLKTHYSKPFLGFGGFGGGDKKAHTSEAVLSEKSAVGGASQTYSSKDFNAKSYAGAEAKPNVPAGAVPTKTTSVPGAASKESLTAEGQALNQKVQKGELTIEQVREILNKNR